MRLLEFVSVLWPHLVLLLLLFPALRYAAAARCPRACSCNKGTLTVSCVGKNLTRVPPNVDEITIKLDLKRNNLGELLRGTFTHTPYLTHLGLQGCKIHSIREGAFRGLARLVQLDLSNNDIEILHQESFDGLTSLKQLYLDRNRIDEIRPGAFSQLGSLKLLSLTHNQLVYIPNLAFQGLLNLETLHFSHNSLNNLANEAFAGLLSLTRLGLDHNELQFFPTTTMTRLASLTHLDLSFNLMTYLGEMSVSMPKLTHLSLAHSALQDLSDAALSLSPRVSRLDLSHNQLRYLQPLIGPEHLSSLNLMANPVWCTCIILELRAWARAGGVKLHGSCAGPPHLSDEPLEAMLEQDLRCRRQDGVIREDEEEEKVPVVPTANPKGKDECPENCQCEPEAHHVSCDERGHTKIPRDFPNNTLLLDMRGNHFHYLPSNSFRHIPEVLSLHLDGCKIHEVEDGAFRGMKELVYLYLSNNELSSLGKSAFAGARQLMYLHLDGNKFTQFPSAVVLAHVPMLLELHLERNLIAKLEPARLLSPIPMLRALYLTNNNISSVSPQALHPAHSLEVLHLGANKLTEVPSQALADAQQLTDLRLSGNPIHWIGPKVFEVVGGTLEHLYLDGQGLKKMSQEALVGLGPSLQSLLLADNLLEQLPNISHLTGVRYVTLDNNPLMCDCGLLPLRSWFEHLNDLNMSATCGYPASLRGQSVKDIDIFRNCSTENIHSTSNSTVLHEAPKSSEPKFTSLTQATAKPNGKPKSTKSKPLVKPSKTARRNPVKSESVPKATQRKTKYKP